MDIPDSLHIPITLQKLQKSESATDDPSKRIRSHHATVYLPEGTTANHACVYITERQRQQFGPTGIWLLQSRPIDENGQPEPGQDFENIKDSKHLLKDSQEYVALYYTGPDIFLM